MNVIYELPSSSWPAVIPAGWRRVVDGELKMLARQMPNGLYATFSIEHYHGGPDRNWFGPCETLGTFRRVVLSRKTMYPTWDEMRDFIRSCGLFDRSRDVFMVLPPDSEYVNTHPNAFHWWQAERP